MSAQPNQPQRPNIINFPSAANAQDQQQMRDLGIGQYVGHQQGYFVVPPPPQQAPSPAPTTPSVDAGTACLLAGIAALLTGIIVYRSPEQANQRQMQQQLTQLQQANEALQGQQQQANQFVNATHNFCKGITQ